MQTQESADDLPLVLAELATVMSASDAALTVHPGDGERPRILYAGDATGLTVDTLDAMLPDHLDWSATDRPGAHRWVDWRLDGAVDGQSRDVMLIPVKPVPGHSPLLISLYFEGPAGGRRARAEAVYARRAPFATGYFRLWQLNRMRSVRVAALEAAIDLTEMGVMLIDRFGRVTFANRSAHEMLRDGSGVRLHRDRLRASQLHDSVRLQMAIEHVIDANAKSDSGDGHEILSPLLSLERDHGPPLVATVLPLRRRATEPTDVAATVYVVDPARNFNDMLKPICKIYRLSPTEARLTCLLAGGSVLADAAKKLKVKEMTARGYLKQIFQKTNTHRQVELIQLMLSSMIRTSSHVVSEPM